MEPQHSRRVHGPFGTITITEAEGKILRLRWEEGTDTDDPTGVLDEASRQLQAYFQGAGDPFPFRLPLHFGEGLQGRFGRMLTGVRFGQTLTYGELARDLGASAQAIGQCCGANPIPIIIPCHRVLGADGLGGFSAPGGIEMKIALLRHEGAASLLI